MDETTEVGSDAGAPVSPTTARRTTSSTAPSPGCSSTSTPPPQDVDHLVNAEERFRLAMAKQ